MKGRYTVFIKYRAKDLTIKSEIVQVDDLTDLNSMYSFIIKIKILTK